MVEKSNPAPRRERWTVERQTRFLTELAATSNVSASVRAAGMSEASVYRLRRRSPEFREAWAVALREGYEKLELMLLDARELCGDAAGAAGARRRTDR